MSLSARRAWIEIVPALKLIACHNVALRKESVDRNKAFSCFLIGSVNVALRKESVDRNLLSMSIWFQMSVALRKESVDRNAHILRIAAFIFGRSPQGERG